MVKKNTDKTTLYLDVLIVGSGFSAGLFSHMFSKSKVGIVDGSYLTHAVTTFGKKQRYTHCGNGSQWGGNLFFDLENTSPRIVSELERLLDPHDFESVGQRYSNKFGYGYLLPKKFLLTPKHPIFHDLIQSVEKKNGRFFVRGLSNNYWASELLLLTGSSCKMLQEGDTIYLNSTLGHEVFDKFLTFELTQEDYGSVSMEISETGCSISRYKLNGTGLSRRQFSQLVKVLHFLNGQLPLSKFCDLKLVGLFPILLSRPLGFRKSQNLYLSTVGFPGYGRNALSFRRSQGRWVGPKISDDKHAVPDDLTYFRALHNEIFQESKIISVLNSWGVVHDQSGALDPGARFGSIGHKLLKAVKTLVDR